MIGKIHQNNDLTRFRYTVYLQYIYSFEQIVNLLSSYLIPMILIFASKCIYDAITILEFET